MILATMLCLLLPDPGRAQVLYLQADGTARTEEGIGPVGSLYQTRANSLSEVRTIAVQGSDCDAAITTEMRSQGFLLANRDNADAVLNVSVRHDGEDGSYSATLEGSDGNALFSTRGEEGAGDLAGLCEDISEEIVDSLEDRLG
jgi:hypothetical protein